MYPNFHHGWDTTLILYRKWYRAIHFVLSPECTLYVFYMCVLSDSMTHLFLSSHTLNFYLAFMCYISQLSLYCKKQKKGRKKEERGERREGREERGNFNRGRGYEIDSSRENCEEPRSWTKIFISPNSVFQHVNSLMEFF